MITEFTPWQSLAGGALPALGTGRVEAFLFIAALIGGLLITRVLQVRTALRRAA